MKTLCFQSNALQLVGNKYLKIDFDSIFYIYKRGYLTPGWWPNSENRFSTVQYAIDCGVNSFDSLKVRMQTLTCGQAELPEGSVESRDWDKTGETDKYTRKPQNKIHTCIWRQNSWKLSCLGEIFSKGITDFCRDALLVIRLTI